jgi:ABC-type transport system substrate-binding protein
MGLSGTGSLVPVLAESYIMSGDGKTYTFTLRAKAKFTDGSPVTADDVVFTVKKAQDPALKSPEYADWSGVQVVAVDAKTVRFTLSKAYAPFLGLTTLGILPSKLWRNVSDTEFPFSTLETNPVGNGPFQVTSVSRNASGLITSVSLSANPHYVLGRPYLDGIRFNFYSNAEDSPRTRSDRERIRHSSKDALTALRACLASSSTRATNRSMHVPSPQGPLARARSHKHRRLGTRRVRDPHHGASAAGRGGEADPGAKRRHA